ncbi:hypothetical protein V1293_005875 [Bradyrhizobium sp. AZCC 1693]
MQTLSINGYDMAYLDVGRDAPQKFCDVVLEFLAA